MLAFVLIGLQLRPILEPLEPGERTRYFYFAGAVLVTVMLVRIAWVMTYNADRPTARKECSELM